MVKGMPEIEGSGWSPFLGIAGEGLEHLLLQTEAGSSAPKKAQNILDEEEETNISLGSKVHPKNGKWRHPKTPGLHFPFSPFFSILLMSPFFLFLVLFFTFSSFFLPFSVVLSFVPFSQSFHSFGTLSFC